MEEFALKNRREHLIVGPIEEIYKKIEDIKLSLKEEADDEKSDDEFLGELLNLANDIPNLEQNDKYLEKLKKEDHPILDINKKDKIHTLNGRCLMCKWSRNDMRELSKKQKEDYIKNYGEKQIKRKEFIEIEKVKIMDTSLTKEQRFKALEMLEFHERDVLWCIEDHKRQIKIFDIVINYYSKLVGIF